MQQPLSEFLTGRDWYDNSRLDVILACKRKAFIGQLYADTGLEAGVGYGALFGTCMHGFAATYYSWWGKTSESMRRVKGIRTFLELHEKFFVGPMLDDIDNKHSKENGIATIDHYCDTYLAEDQLLIPLEVELAGAVEIKPQEGEDFKPFWYAFKIDGIHKRSTYGDLWVREMKNTSGGVKRELVKLRLSRQPTGYVYCARQFPGPAVTGCMPDVVGVLAKNKECQRDFFAKPMVVTDNWRKQTIEIVEHWRTMKARAANLTFENVLNIFYQNTQECTSYGLCAFYDICRDGFSPATLAAFRPNKWNPLEDQIHIQRETVETPQGILETHKVIA